MSITWYEDCVTAEGTYTCEITQDTFSFLPRTHWIDVDICDDLAQLRQERTEARLLCAELIEEYALAHKRHLIERTPWLANYLRPVCG